MFDEISEPTEMLAVEKMEQAIDLVPLRQPILGQPRSFTIWNLLVAYEQIELESEGLARSRREAFPSSGDRWKNALKHCLGWAMGHSRDWRLFALPKALKEPLNLEARSYLTLGAHYQAVETAFKEWRKGTATIELISESEIVFRLDPEEMRYDVLDLLNFTPAGEDVGVAFLSGDFSRNRFIDMSNSIREVTHNQLEINIGQSLFGCETENNLKNVKIKSKLPPGWSFREISLESFQLVWAGLLTFTAIHFGLFINAAQSRKVLREAAGSCLFILSINDFLEKLSNTSPTIPSEHALEVIRLLTYDSSVSKPDPALQPIVRIGKEMAFVPPHLVLSSRFERNLIQLLAREYKAEYDNISNVLDPHMTNDLATRLTNLGFLVCKSRSPLTGLGETDLIVYEKRSGTVLIVECKWVIQPAETNEIFSRGDAEIKGQVQAQKRRQYASENVRRFFASAFPSESITDGVKVEACVCMRGFVGMAKNFRDDIPTIEEKLFVRHLSKYKNLVSTISWMKSREYLPLPGRDFEIVFTKHQIGPYMVNWNSMQVEIQTIQI